MTRREVVRIDVDSVVRGEANAEIAIGEVATLSAGDHYPSAAGTSMKVTPAIRQEDVRAIDRKVAIHPFGIRHDDIRIELAPRVDRDDCTNDEGNEKPR